MSIAHRIAPTSSQPSEITPSTNQGYSSFNQSNHVTKEQEQELLTSLTTTTTTSSEVSQSQANSRSHLIGSEPNPDLARATVIKIPDCGSSREIQKCPTKGQVNISHNGLSHKKKKKFDETIVDGFAISAFKSWEDLQDELNERIASSQAKNLTAEKNHGVTPSPKKKHKIKPSNPQSTNDSSKPSPQTKTEESKTEEPNTIGKNIEVIKFKKSSHSHPSTSGETTINCTKHKDSNASKETSTGDSPIYHPISQNQGQQFFQHPCHRQQPPTNPYMYQTTHSSMQPSMSAQSNIRMPIQTRFPQHPHDTNHQQLHRPHQMQPPRAQPHAPMPPFSMYPPFMPHHSQSSSMVASMSMSSLPAPYGSPYIVTDTTISRQTSIIPPPPPSTLEQAAATSMASRFDHHTSILHPFSAYNPAAAMTQSPNPPTLYPSPFSTDRNYMQFSRDYDGSSGPIANYHNMMNPFPPPAASVTANSYSLDRYPKTAFDYHQHAVSMYNSLYNNNVATLPDNRGFRNGPMGHPPFPASFFPRPI